MHFPRGRRGQQAHRDKDEQRQREARHDGVQAGVTGEDLPCAARRGVALEDAGDVFTQAEKSGGHIDLNMANVRSMDSAFVGLLLLLDQSLRERGLVLRLLRTPRAIRRILQLSGVQHLVLE